MNGFEMNIFEEVINSLYKQDLITKEKVDALLEDKKITVEGHESILRKDGQDE